MNLRFSNTGSWVAHGNGNRPENGKHKRYCAHLHLKPIQALQLTLYADYYARPRITNPFAGGTNVQNAVMTSTAFVGYEQRPGFRVGVEFLFFSSVDILNQLELVVRFDYFDPNLENDVKGDSRKFILGGFAWNVDKKGLIDSEYPLRIIRNTAKRNSISGFIHR